MSKIFYSLCYFLLIIIFSLVFFIIKTELVFAVDQTSFKITQTPLNPVPVTEKRITIKVETADGSDYFIAPQYNFVAWTDSKSGKGFSKENRCRVINQPFWRGSYETGKLEITKSTATASWDIEEKIDNYPCIEPGKTWHFLLFAGTNEGDMNNSENWVLPEDYSFTFVQQGGQVATIEAKNKDVYAGEQPTVIITNIAPGDDYTFWWKRVDTFDIFSGVAGYYSNNKNPANPSEIIFPTPSTDKPSRQLCMTYGHLLLPPDNPIITVDRNCDQSVTFNFKMGKRRPVITPPPGSLTAKCTILPSTSPPLNSEASIKIEGLPNGTKVAAYAEDPNGNPLATSQRIIDNTNSVTLNLVKKVVAGTYYAVAYNEADGQKVCPNLTFIGGGTLVAPTIAPCTGAECTKGGGDSCGTAASPGIKTAIGCVHTNPAEFVKDLLTWVIGISGGIAFLMMVLGAFQMLTSDGNPETLQTGRDRLTSAVIGLLFIIFAVLLLQIIGIGILNIPGFQK